MKKILRHKNILCGIFILFLVYYSQLASKFIDQPFDDLQVNLSNNHLIVHFLDIGQADCILIQDSKGHTVLIDAGNEGDSKYIQSYLLNLGIRKIDVLIATHPHEDHIGSMDDIVYTFEVAKIYTIKDDYPSSSNRNFLEAVNKKGYELTYASAGSHFRLGDANFQILSPNKKVYPDLNYRSLVTKVSFGDVSFLFMADAEGKVLNEIINSNYDLKSDVIKIGHHGSSVSTPIHFIRAVQPKIAVISVRDHSISYPHFLTLSTLKIHNVETYMTAGSGSVIITTDGKSIRSYRSIYKNTDKKSLEK